MDAHPHHSTLVQASHPTSTHPTPTQPRAQSNPTPHHATPHHTAPFNTLSTHHGLTSTRLSTSTRFAFLLSCFRTPSSKDTTAGCGSGAADSTKGVGATGPAVNIGMGGASRGETSGGCTSRGGARGGGVVGGGVGGGGMSGGGARVGGVSGGGTTGWGAMGLGGPAISFPMCSCLRAAAICAAHSRTLSLPPARTRTCQQGEHRSKHWAPRKMILQK